MLILHYSNTVSGNQNLIQSRLQCFILNVMDTFVSKLPAGYLKYFGASNCEAWRRTIYPGIQALSYPGANEPILSDQIRCNTICEGIKCTGMQFSGGAELTIRWGLCTCMLFHKILQHIVILNISGDLSGKSIFLQMQRMSLHNNAPLKVRNLHHLSLTLAGKWDCENGDCGSRDALVGPLWRAGLLGGCLRSASQPF